MALGGTRGDLLRLACGLTDVLRIVLAGVSPGDPATFAMVTPVLAVAVFSEARFQRGGPWASIRRWLCDMSDTGDRGRWERSARR